MPDRIVGIPWSFPAYSLSPPLLFNIVIYIRIQMQMENTWKMLEHVYTVPNIVSGGEDCPRELR